MLVPFQNIAVIGSSGTIGNALGKCLSFRYPDSSIHLFSRNTAHKIDYSEEATMRKAADIASRTMPLDLVIIATGALHSEFCSPEKSIKDLSKEKFINIFEINAVTPALLAKYFLPKMSQRTPSVFMILSAKLGSISDNSIGGWYAYRMSKAALNMLVKNLSIEMNRKNKKNIVVSMHPGTVDSPLSKPYQRHLLKKNIFSPDYSASKIITVLEGLTSNDNGVFFSWDGSKISP